MHPWCVLYLDLGGGEEVKTVLRTLTGVGTWQPSKEMSEGTWDE